MGICLEGVDYDITTVAGATAGSSRIASAPTGGAYTRVVGKELTSRGTETANNRRTSRDSFLCMVYKKLPLLKSI